MKANHSKWIPIVAFLLAVVMSVFAGPATSRLLARDPGSSTGDCTPPAPPAKIVPKANCDKFQKPDPISFDPANPPSGMPPLQPGEDALTTCSMVITWTGDFDATVCKNPDGSCVAIGYAKSIDANFSGKATIYLPNGAQKLLIDHENGHADICQAACEASCSQLKATIGNAPQNSPPVKSGDCESATKAADTDLESLIQAFLNVEQDDDVAKEQKASDDYDTDTGHGTKGDQKKEAKTQSTNVTNAIFPPPPKK